MTVVTIANRLPVRRGDDGWQLSPGGLVTALRPVMAAHAGAWVGWDGGARGIPATLPDLSIRLVPVGLSAAQVRTYYHGFANATLWPLLHDAIEKPRFERAWWHGYQGVNAIPRASWSGCWPLRCCWNGARTCAPGSPVRCGRAVLPDRARAGAPGQHPPHRPRDHGPPDPRPRRAPVGGPAARRDRIPRRLPGARVLRLTAEGDLWLPRRAPCRSARAAPKLAA
jgi:hypothetical protein